MPGASEHVQDGRLASTISNRVVRVMNEVTGRGPTQARTYLHDDLISVIVRDTLTRGERSLVADGKSAVVIEVRHEFQKTMQSELCAAIEELTGREVIAFFSANHIDPDTALESFLLAPQVKDQAAERSGGA